VPARKGMWWGAPLKGEGREGVDGAQQPAFLSP